MQIPNRYVVPYWTNAWYPKLYCIILRIDIVIGWYWYEIWYQDGEPCLQHLSYNKWASGNSPYRFRLSLGKSFFISQSFQLVVNKCYLTRYFYKIFFHAIPNLIVKDTNLWAQRGKKKKRKKMDTFSFRMFMLGKQWKLNVCNFVCWILVPQVCS